MRVQTNSVISWLTTKRRAASTPSLGSRELEVMELLWTREAMSALDVLDCLADGDVGLSTLQSTLERLHRKEMVTRAKHSRAYVYTPRVTRSQIISALLHDITQEIAGGDVAPLVSGFIDYLGTATDPAARAALGEALANQEISRAND